MVQHIEQLYMIEYLEIIATLKRKVKPLCIIGALWELNSIHSYKINK